MAELITYSIKASVCMILLYGLYVLTLSKETHFRFNRVYLLFSLIISLIIPLLNITLYSGNAETVFANILLTVQVGSDAVIIAQNGISGTNYIGIIFLAGIVIFSLRFVSRFISLYLIRIKCRIEKKNRLCIALCSNQIAPFSFLNTIFIDEETKTDEQFDKIIMHETCHIRQFHSIDIIFAEIICLLTWFNPVSWLIKAALKETHEYLADSGVSEQTTGFAEYFLLLARNVVGVQPGLANNFNKSLTLKRMNMMKKDRSSRFSMLKALPVIPILIILFIAFSCGKKADDLKSQFSPALEKNEKQANTPGIWPEFRGGWAALTKFIMDNVKYPESCKYSGIEDIVFVGFVVNKTGKVEKIYARSHFGNILLEAEAIRVVSMMPDWIPGEKNGIPIDVELTQPIYFKYKGK